jgi:hypothetical protein
VHAARPSADLRMSAGPTPARWCGASWARAAACAAVLAHRWILAVLSLTTSQISSIANYGPRELITRQRRGTCGGPNAILALSFRAFGMDAAPLGSCWRRTS